MHLLQTLRSAALALPETAEEPHFEKTSFRVRKKIFATYDAQLKQLCVKLSADDQHVFTTLGKELVYPVPNKWGTLGWTLIQLDAVPEEMLTEALRIAYCTVAPKKLALQVRTETKE